MRVVSACMGLVVLSRIISFTATVRATQIPLGDYLPFGRFAMYSNRDLPGKFNSSISLDLQIHSDCLSDCNTSSLVLAIVPYSEVRATLGNVNVCNVSSYEDKKVALYRQIVQTFGEVLWTQVVEETDLYEVIVGLCGGQVNGVSVSGSLRMLNPYGYLPGETYPYLTFFFVAVCAYGLLLGVWTALLYWFWTSAIPLQKCYIPWLLIVCAGEEGLSYLSWNYLNTTGFSSYPFFVSCLVMNSIRNTLARVLLLVLSMGYGITIPQLKYKGWIVALGVMFFVANLAYIAVGVVQHFAYIRLHYLFLATLPISLLSTVFYMWTFFSLARTLRKLQAEQQPYKLSIFKRLTIIFVLAIVSTFVWFFVECYYRFAQDREDYWQIVWRFEAAWHVIFFATIAGVILLWRPTAQSKLLAFTLELVEPKDVSASDLGKGKGVELHQIGYEGESN